LILTIEAAIARGCGELLATTLAVLECICSGKAS
jgi:hypothetical protein